MRKIVNVFMVCMLPFLSCFSAYSPLEMGAYDDRSFEVQSLKCDTNTLGYVLGLLDIHGFTILSISCNEPEEPKWVVNYCATRWSLPGPI